MRAVPKSNPVKVKQAGPLLSPEIAKLDEIYVIWFCPTPTWNLSSHLIVEQRHSSQSFPMQTLTWVFSFFTYR